MTARGAAGRCPPTTWLGPRLLLVCLLVSRSITEKDLKNCSYMIGDGHLRLLQQLIDSQMETSCSIDFEFVDQKQLKDPVCYLKKAFFLVKAIMEDTMRFKDNTSNAKALATLQELSVMLQDCFPREEQDKACVRTFHETPLWLLEKIKNVFNETKTLLKKDQNIFSKNCSTSFAECFRQGHEQPQPPERVSRLLVPGSSCGGVILALLAAVGGLLFYRRRRRSHQAPQTVDSPMERQEGSPLTQDEDRQVELPV
ncbi:colony stimulating factor 1 [Rhinolophus ferrumequinum]|uniref:Macrophage colony-stimulating factor 1 n=1 Tax=Rhinolophus ferrumequinum TaxID=59479 RepID=A0A7J7SWV4_RHIFE|nr:macrophage colony-stimulating factor 1 isoform X2 [Rhinolophus ferrumequinum]KAF6292703.1 colony stimulating factor 1 [Rhinolophus ferrumequinum]